MRFAVALALEVANRSTMFNWIALGRFARATTIEWLGNVRAFFIGASAFAAIVRLRMGANAATTRYYPHINNKLLSRRNIDFIYCTLTVRVSAADKAASKWPGNASLCAFGGRRSWLVSKRASQVCACNRKIYDIEKDSKRRRRAAASHRQAQFSCFLLCDIRLCRL